MKKKPSAGKNNVTVKWKKFVVHTEEQNVEDDDNEFLEDIVDDHSAKRIKKVVGGKKLPIKIFMLFFWTMSLFTLKRA